MTLIAFTGRLGSGKDTAGERLAAMVDVPAYQLSFARPLKESAAALLDIPVEDWETYKNDPEVKILLQVGWGKESFMSHEIEAPNIIKELTAREFLQRYGTEAHREIFGTDFWVEQAFRTYDEADHIDNPLFYVTDCRFENEARAVLARGGVIVRVCGVNEDTGTHASEQQLDNQYITFEIDNLIRDDYFESLDRSLMALAGYLSIPLKDGVLR